MIYLDNAATSFPRPEAVYEEMDRVNRNLSVNAGRGGYKAAREAAKLIQNTKSGISDLFHCGGLADVVFTPSITQAMNQIINGQKIQKLTEYLISKLDDNNNITVLSMKTPGMCYGIVSFIVERYDANDVGSILDDEFDIAVRTGYHCAPYIHDYLNDKVYGGTIRVGIGPFNTEQDIDDLVKGLETL